MTILVTGANGFVGTALCRRLVQGGHNVRGVMRTLTSAEASQAGEVVVVDDIGPGTDWCGSLDGVDAVVHLAGRVHVLADSAADPITEFRRVNTAGTERLARAAAAAGVRRFVFISSIKVNGESSQSVPFLAEDRPAPKSPYAISKWEAEQILRRVAADTGLEMVVIRPPLVYGPGVKANFLRLLQWVDRGIPLPLASVDNRRSLVALDNLVDLIVRCVEHPAAAGQVFLVSDGEDLSTPELVRRIAVKMGRSPKLFPFPPALLRYGARVLGKQAAVERLCGSLQVNIGKTKQVLAWTPPVTADEALERTVEWYRNGSVIG